MRAQFGRAQVPQNRIYRRYARMLLLLHARGGALVDAFGVAHRVRLDAPLCEDVDVAGMLLQLDGCSLRLLAYSPLHDEFQVFQLEWPPAEGGEVAARRVGGGRVPRPERALARGCSLHARDPRVALWEFLGPRGAVARVAVRYEPGAARYESGAARAGEMHIEEHARGLDGAEARAARAAKARFAQTWKLELPDDGSLRPRTRHVLFDALSGRCVARPRVGNGRDEYLRAFLVGREGWLHCGSSGQLLAPPRLGSVVLPRRAPCSVMAHDDCSSFLLARNEWSGQTWLFRTGTLADVLAPRELPLEPWPRAPWGAALCARVAFESAAARTARVRRRRIWRAELAAP